jgi:ferredoxin
MMGAHDCPHCGAPVGEDGRYERPCAPNNVTQELERLREMARGRPPVIGSPRWYREQTGHESGCVMCGGELPANSGIYWKRVASHRLYCSDACRQRAYRMRRKASVTNADPGPPS